MLRSPSLAGDGWVMGIDVGGTLIKGALVSPTGEVREQLRTPTDASQGPQTVIERVTEMLDAAALAAGCRVGTVGLGVPGFVNEDAGIVEFSANLGWKDFPVRRLLSERLGVAVVLGHDVRLGGRAEGDVGAARGAEDYLFVAVGTGIAASLTLGGQQRRGPSGLAGEIGHVVAEPGGPLCRCGGRGCLEEMASASGIGRRYREIVPGPVIGSAEVLTLALEGDEVAREVWASSVRYLGRALAQVQGALQLEVVVIGGGLAKAGTELLVPLEAAVRDFLPCLQPPRLVLAELGDQAACLGAALLARGLRGGALDEVGCLGQQRT